MGGMENLEYVCLSNLTNFSEYFDFPYYIEHFIFNIH